MKDSKLRFSNRAENYARYRPGYPREVLAFLEEECNLTTDSVVADVGSGTGILSKLFLENGNRVFGVEPNKEMREAAARLLSDYLLFESVAGPAEATGLADGSVDLVAAGNAFHWFDADAAQVEFSRILKPDGRVAIVGNGPKRSGTPFREAYARLTSEHRTDDGGGAYKDMPGMVEAFFGEDGYETASFPNALSLDLEGLKGLLLSHSSVPAEGEPGSEAMLRDLEEAFHANEAGGRVTVEYVTWVYCGRLR